MRHGSLIGTFSKETSGCVLVYMGKQVYTYMHLDFILRILTPK